MSPRALLARPLPAAVLTAVVVLPAVIPITMMSTTGSAPQPVDFDVFGPAGADLLAGRWSGIFGDPILQAGPLELLPWGVLQRIGVSSGVGWTIALVVCASLTAFLAAIVLRPTLRPDPRSSALAAGGALLLALTGPITAGWSIGHPAEVLVPLVWAVAGRLAVRDRPIVAAVLVAASSGFEVWGVLGAPVVLLAPRPRLLRSAVAGAVTLAVLWAPFVLAGPFRMFAYSWGVSDQSLLHLLLPGATAAPWSWRLVQAVLAIGAGSAAALLLRGRNAAWGPWGVAAAAVAGRLVLDPVLSGYYWYPVLVGVTGALVLAVHRRDLIGAAVVALCLLLAAETGVPPLRAALLLAVLLVGAALLRLRRGPAPLLRRPVPA